MPRLLGEGSAPSARRCPPAPARRHRRSPRSRRFRDHPTDIEDLRIFDRYHAEPGAGLQFRVHADRAIAGGTLHYHSTPITLMLPPNALTALWHRASGAWEFAESSEGSTENDAFGPRWIATTTDSAGVTDLQERRTFAADTAVMNVPARRPDRRGPRGPTMV